MQVNKKYMLARLFIIGASVALLGTTASANPFVLDWRVLGFGQDSGTCETGTFMSGCTSITAGSAQGTHIGSGAYSLTVTTGNDKAGGGTDNHATNASGGKCLPANNTGPGMITAADGSTINFNTVGWLCEEGSPGSSYHYNGTYRITGGTGRFSGAVGGGSLTYTVEKPGLLSGTSYMKIDGTINF
ncbi:MAG TPA: hypothetical protein VE734_04510 [Terriglobales bacterium]|nr:hypothetical protein [Terriglobales bacterium]